MTPSPVFLRYLLFQIPGFCFAGIALSLLVRWTALTETGGWILFALWVIKDLALYPWMRIGYEPRPANTGADALRGAIGTALTALAPDAPGQVQIGPERWNARLSDDANALAQGDPVRVVALQGLTLVVEAADA
ncbi:MAG: NfeD family protein [Deltaproteobacteria bacterium]|nr:NfeD family protein [Deltaproteobacteria bacterium]